MRTSVMVKSVAVVLAIVVFASRPAAAQAVPVTSPPAVPIVLRVGRLVDPEAGTSATNQILVIQNGRFAAIGADVPIPAGARTSAPSSQYGSYSTRQERIRDGRDADAG